MSRPSENEIFKRSSVSETSVTLGNLISVAEIVIPKVQDKLFSIGNNRNDCRQFTSIETVTGSQSRRLKPEFCFGSVTFVRREPESVDCCKTVSSAS